MHNVAHSPAPKDAAKDPGPRPVLFGGAQPPPVPGPAPDFEWIQRSGQFVTLRKRLRRFVFPMSLLFFGWYMTYVLLAAYSHDFMRQKVYGEINIAIVLGVLQFVTTIGITFVYVRFAKRRIDPLVTEIRRQAGV